MIPSRFLLLIVVGAMMSVGLAKPTASKSDEDDKDSIYRAAYATQMLSYMNLSVRPCDDFYEYACGNWKNTIKDRNCHIRRHNFLDIRYTIDDFVESILQRSDIDEVAPEYAAEFELAKNIYQKCLDTELYPMRKSPEYLEMIQKMGGFPAVDPKWSASQFSWINMSAHLSNYGVESLINEKIKDVYPYTPLFYLPNFGLDIELHYDTIGNLSSNEYELNRKRMHSILALYGVTEDKIEHIIADIFVFLKDILNVLAKFEENQSKCEKLARELDESDWDAITQQWMPYFDIAWMGKPVKLGENNGPCMFFYHELNKMAAEHKEAMANYLSLTFLYHMDAQLQDPKFHIGYCAINLKTTMNFFFDHLYMKIHFNKEISEDVRKMAEEIRQSLRTVLQEADWLDDTTRAAALLKESTVGIHVGRFEDTELINRLLGELKTLKFVDGSYEANRINQQRFTTHMTRYYGLHADDFSSNTKPMEVLLGTQINAFMYLADNHMYVSAAALQPPVYDQKWPSSLKYGTLGFVLGHEFSHAFDTSGCNYDHTGDRRYWWSDESEQKFNERARCFVDFYSNYTVPEINRNIKGDLTKDENIADAGALHTSLMAYRRYMNEEIQKSDSMSAFNNEEQMPGMEASPEQLFFLGAAQMWCASFKEADYWTQLRDYHTIDKYRVLGMVSNNKDFAKAYNCPIGSNMNPTADKCELW